MFRRLAGTSYCISSTATAWVAAVASARARDFADRLAPAPGLVECRNSSPPTTAALLAWTSTASPATYRHPVMRGISNRGHLGFSDRWSQSSLRREKPGCGIDDLHRYAFVGKRPGRGRCVRTDSSTSPGRHRPAADSSVRIHITAVSAPSRIAGLAAKTIVGTDAVTPGLTYRALNPLPRPLPELVEGMPIRTQYLGFERMFERRYWASRTKGPGDRSRGTRWLRPPGQPREGRFRFAVATKSRFAHSDQRCF
jgi:hypothetical protein